MHDFNYDNFKQLEAPNEAQIVRQWAGKDRTPLISVVCITYNHARYLEDALLGILMQRTRFPFEIVIHDDASSDGTQEIIRQYAQRYPRLIKPVLQTENQFSKGRNMYKFAASYASAATVAICEGDDFWVDPNKLEIQHGVMKAHPRATLVVHPGLDYNERRRRALPAFQHGHEISRFDAQDVLNVAGQFAPTASYMVRSDVFDHCPNWIDSAPVGDFFLEMYSLAMGHGMYIPKIMSAYRSYSVGSWTDIRRSAKGDHLIEYGRRMNQCFLRMRQEEPFKKLNFDVKRSVIHLDTAIGHLLNKEFSDFQKEIAQSYALNPNYNLIQQVFQHLRWSPRSALMLFKTKRRLNLLLGLS